MVQVTMLDARVATVGESPQLLEASKEADRSARRTVVVIPAYNEERFIGSVVLKVKRYVDCVVVVDDGSTDGTAEVAEAAGAIVERHEQNRGKGEALNTGFRRARALGAEMLVTLDGDGQHLPEEIERVLGPIVAGQADIVIGSRYLCSSETVPRHRVIGHQVFNFMTSRLSGVTVTDSQSGYRAFSRRAIDLLTFNARGFAVESEMQWLAREHGLRLAEVPVQIRYLDKPKRPVVMHGLLVLSGILRLMGQYRPLLFFGLPGGLLLLLGLAGVWIGEAARPYQSLPVGPTIVSWLIATLAALSLFTGIILHSVRGLLLDLVRPRE